MVEIDFNVPDYRVVVDDQSGNANSFTVIIQNILLFTLADWSSYIRSILCSQPRIILWRFKLYSL